VAKAAVRARNTPVKAAVKALTRRSSVAEQAIETSSGPRPTERHRTKWLVVSSPKGGSGKTTSVVNLAVFAAHAGLNVAILDTDMQESAKDWWELRPDDAPRIHFVGQPLNKVDEAIEAVGAIPNLDLVIVDTPTAVEYFPTETATLLEQADLVLVPSTTGRPDVKSVMGWMSFLKGRRVLAAYVINRANARATVPSRGKNEDEQPLLGTLAFRAAQRKLNKSGVLCPFPIRQLEDIQTTHEVGVGVLEMNRAKGADDFEAVWDFVRNMIGL
jgi:chromosome partitioning protein